MVTLDLEENMSSGAVSLLDLPAALERLNLRKNRIASVVGTVNCLPPGISRVDVSCRECSPPNMYHSMEL